MNNSYRKTALLLSILFIMGSSMAGKEHKEERRFSCSPVVLEFRQDTVHYSFTATIHAKQIKKHESMVFTPELLLVDGNDSSRISLPPVRLEGVLYTKLQQREAILANQNITYNEYNSLPAGIDTLYTIPYEGEISIEDGYKFDQILAYTEVNSCSKSKTYLEGFTNFSYINAEISRPILPTTLRGDGITSENLKIRKVEGHAFIHFEINKADIQLSKSNNKSQIEQMTHAFNKIITDPYARFDSAHILGQSSPEGPFEWNNKLAIRRSNSALAFLKKELDQLNIPYNESQFKLSAIPEAWDELYKKIEHSQLDEKEKRAVLNIIRNTPIKAEREYLLRLRRQTFKYISEELLGKIRRVDYAFFLTFKDLTLEEQINLLQTRPDIYSPSDFLAVANYMTDVNRKIETLQIARNFYPENPDILATLLDAYIHAENRQDAQTMIDEIKDMSHCVRNHKFLRNISVFYFMNGQEDLLEEQLHSLLFNPQSLTDDTKKEIKYQQGLLALSGRKYSEASHLLATFDDLNKVMALLGEKRYEDAWNTAQLCPCLNAREYYIKAIAAAYAEKDEQAIELLTQALTLDGALYEEAKKEDAFRTIIGSIAINNNPQTSIN